MAASCNRFAVPGTTFIIVIIIIIIILLFLLSSQVVERDGTGLPSWMTSVTGGRCDEEHVTGSRDEAGECAGVLLEGVAGPQEIGLRYELVVRSATMTDDRRCVVESVSDQQDAFFVQVIPGTHCTRYSSSSSSLSSLLSLNL